MQPPFNPPHSSGQFLPLLHHNLLTSSQISHLLTPIPLIYNFSSSDTEQIKQNSGDKEKQRRFHLGKWRGIWKK
jgi:hypothetical protein